VLSALALCAAIATRAAAPSAPHWPDGARVLVWIDGDRAPAGAPALIERALSVWTDAAGGHLRLARAAARDEARIRIRFAGGDGVYGEAMPRVDRSTGLIQQADVAINADVPEGLDGRIVIYLTALHELGHALGLRHSDSFSAIMYRFRRPDDGERFFGGYRRKIRSADDIGTARATGLDSEDVAALRDLYTLRR
jgi:hypothetical protein